MIYLLCAIISSCLISVAMKCSLKYTDSRYGKLLFNYVICTAAAFFFAMNNKAGFTGDGLVWAAFCGIVMGVLYLAAFTLLNYNVRKNGVILAGTFQKLGVVVPAAAAVTIFGEKLTMHRGAGLLLAIIAIIVMQEKRTPAKADETNKKSSAGKSMTALILLLVCGGTSDVIIKFYEFYGNPDLGDIFLFITFAAALIVCVLILIKSGEIIKKADIISGILIGIPNYFSAYFLLKAVGVMDSVIVYPVYSVVTILLLGIIGIFVFKEKLTMRQTAGYAGILAAIYLLNM